MNVQKLGYSFIPSTTVLFQRLEHFSDSFIQSGQLLQELGHVLGRDFYHCGVETVVLADSTGLFTCLLEGEGEVAEEKREG